MGTVWVMESAVEVQELRNKLRMMKFPQDDILNTVRRQQRAIQKQKQANDTIRREIDEYEAEIARLDARIAEHQSDEQLQKLEAQRKSLSNKHSILKADLAAEEARKRKLADDVSRCDSKQGGLFKQSRENEQAMGRIRTMENRLDKSMVRYNSNLQVLEGLRSRIDELRKDRFNFRDTCVHSDQQREKLDQEVQKLIGDSNSAYSERDRRRMELARLREAEKTDQASYEEKLERLNQTIEGQRLAQARAAADTTGAVTSGDSQAGSQSDGQDELTQKADQLQATLARTFELCHFKDEKELFAEAEALEREEFSYFKCVQELGNANAQLAEEIGGLEFQQESLKAQSGMSEEQMSGELVRLTEQIEAVSRCVQEEHEGREAQEEQFAAVYGQVGAIVAGIQWKRDKADGTKEDIDPWQGAPDGKQEVTPQNVMFCLAQIETATTSLMLQVYEKAKMECNIRDIRMVGPPGQGLITEERFEQLKHTTAPKLVVGDKKELEAKVADVNRPLTVEEMREILGDGQTGNPTVSMVTLSAA